MVGARIKHARRRRGWTIKQLAERTRLTPSFLSQIERGVASPSIASLQRIAGSLAMPAFYLLLDTEHGSPVVRSSARRLIKHPGVAVPYELLCPPASATLEVAIATLPPGVASSAGFLSHEGEECVLVLAGFMQAMLAESSHFLSKGDSIFLNSLVPHRYLNCGTEQLVFLVAMAPKQAPQVEQVRHGLSGARID